MGTSRRRGFTSTDLIVGLLLAAVLIPLAASCVKKVRYGDSRMKCASNLKQIGQSILRDRLIAILSSAFGVLGLGLAALGLFGVVSQGVVQRTREIGVRMALGAGAGRVRWEVMREGLRLACLGAALGLVVGWVALRTVSGLLYGVRPTDPSITLGCVAILVAVAAVASFLPARRASRTDPMVALRSD